jgi:hypothetical protein
MKERAFRTTLEPAAASSARLLTRREFLWWSTALGASAALPLGWVGSAEAPVRLGFVGLGSRGGGALATCLELGGAEVVALCDLRKDALRSALSKAGAAASLATPDAGRLFADRSVDAVVLAVSAGAQLELAAAACAAGKDVFLQRPVPFDLAGLGLLNEEATKRGRQVQVARATGFVLEPGAAGRLVATDGAGLAGAEVRARFQTPERPDAQALLAELLDEMDFAQALLTGRVNRLFKVGGPGILPGRWIDQRLQFEVTDGDGARRPLGIAMIARRGDPAPKESQIILGGAQGAARLEGSPLPAGDPLDLGAFLAAVRTRKAGVGLPLSRLLDLSESLSITGRA